MKNLIPNELSINGVVCTLQDNELLIEKYSYLDELELLEISLLLETIYPTHITFVWC
jgi:hypothetical protein